MRHIYAKRTYIDHVGSVSSFVDHHHCIFLFDKTGNGLRYCESKYLLIEKIKRKQIKWIKLMVGSIPPSHVRLDCKGTIRPIIPPKKSKMNFSICTRVICVCVCACACVHVCACACMHAGTCVWGCV